MRSLKHVDVTGTDTQSCLIEISKCLSERGIAEDDIISIQRQWNEDASRLQGNKSSAETASVTVFVFYWSK